MRRLLILAALAAATTLAGCTVKTPEGAACEHIGLSDQCPEGQRCGADGVCSVAAVECAEICAASTCSSDGRTLRLCTPDPRGVCAISASVPCNDYQTCSAVDEACVCPATCGAFRECRPLGSGTSCECVDDQGCTRAGHMCSGDGTATIECVEEVDGCRHPLDPMPCALGKTCSGLLPNASCECPARGSIPETGCVAGSAATCTEDGKLLTCVPVVDGSSCSVWRVVLDCAGNGLSCTPGGVGACTCPSPSGSPPTLFADAASPIHPLVQPNGADLDRCRFTTLQAAVVAASQGSTVKAGRTGASSRFSEPGFVIQGGVNVVGDESAPARPSQVEIELTGGGVQGLALETGASLSGVTVRRAAAAAATTGIEVRGASPATGMSLKDVVVDAQGAGGAFEVGIKVTGSGDVGIASVSVAGASLVGLLVSRQAGDQAVQVTDASIDGKATAPGSAIGIKVDNGSVELARTGVKLSSGVGISASPTAGGSVRLTVKEGQIHDNFGTGVLAQRVTVFKMTDSYVCNNIGGPPRTIDTESRVIGGLYLDGVAPGVAADQAFTGNRVFLNAGDQIAVGLGLGTWSLDGQSSAGTCTPGRNAISSYAAGSFGLVAANNVDARFNGWANVPPQIGIDVHVIGLPTVRIGIEGTLSEYCSLPAGMTCPSP